MEAMITATMICNRCGSSKIIKMGKTQASGELKQRYYCNKCLHFFIKKG